MRIWPIAFRMKTNGLQFPRWDDRFKPAIGHRPKMAPARIPPANGNDPSGGVWLEVFSRPLKPALPNPKNSPQRVLFEVFLVLAAAALVVAAEIVWGPALS